MKAIQRRWWDFPAVVLLFFTLITSAARLTFTGWTHSLGPVGPLTTLGLILGVALGLSHFRRGITSMLAFFYSLVLIPWAFAEYLYARVEWLFRLEDLGERLENSIRLLSNQQPVEDTLLFALIMSVLYWIISLYAGYILTRHASFLGGVLPAAVVTFVVQLFDYKSPYRIGFLVAFLFFAILLLGRLNYMRRRSFWKENNIFQSVESGSSLNGAMVIAALVLILTVSITPSPERSIVWLSNLWDRVVEPLDDSLGGLGNITAGLQGDQGIPIRDFYADTLGLGRQASTSEELIFRIGVPRTPVVSRHYWRVRTYDLYEQDRWSSSFEATQDFIPDRDVFQVPYEEAAVGEFTFESVSQKIYALVTPTRPIWIDRPATITIFPTGDGSLEPLIIRATPPINAGDQYHVRAVLVNPTILELRTAGEDYPDWVLDYYLQLPDDLPERVRSLALELTGGAETPYDKVASITSYLRSAILYTKSLPEPPLGRDTLDWFLFDLKEGYCNYYATAEVILLRAAGVPARMAAGFAQGERDPDSFDTRLVRFKDAHAWPEVYFPDMGWIEFEPTSDQPALMRPRGETINVPNTPPLSDLPVEEEADLPAATASVVESPGEQEKPTLTAPKKNIWPSVIMSVGIVGVIVAGMFIYKRYRPVIHLDPPPILAMKALQAASLPSPRWLSHWAYLVSLPPVGRAFETIFRSLHRLGKEAPLSSTPAEAAAALTQLIPEAGAAISTLLNEYQKSIYSQRLGALHAARQAAISIRQHTQREYLRRLMANLRRRLSFSRRERDHED